MQPDYNHPRPGSVETDPLVKIYVTPLTDRPFTMEFKMSDTIGKFRDEVCHKIKEEHLRIRNPEELVLRVLFQPDDLQNEWTFGYLLGDVKCSQRLTIVLYPPVVLQKAWQPFPKLVEDCESEEEADVVLGAAKRPKTKILPWSCQEIVVDGPLLMKDEEEPIPVQKFRYCNFLRTTAAVVLLALNDRIWNYLRDFNAQHNYQYLIVRVSWDFLSYAFLRKLRIFYNSIPIVAVTDLHPYDLDLLTFLDTIPDHVKPIYGWDLFQDCENFEVTHIEYVDIMWLGLRPSDCAAHHFDAHALALPLPRDFDKVINRVMWNGHFSRKKEWVQELKCLQESRKCYMFQPMGPLKDLISARLSDKDWI